MTETKLFYSAAEVAQLLGISVGQTYRLMRQWNKELAAKHYLVIAGKYPCSTSMNKFTVADRLRKSPLPRPIAQNLKRKWQLMANSAQKDPKTGKWLVQFRYTDWTGQLKKTTKRGFDTKKQAEEWLRNFLTAKATDMDMTFGSLVELYFEDLGKRLREYTLRNKHYLIDGKILPYFKDKSVSSITPADIRKWQAEMLSKGYADTYLRSLYNQLNAVFNYAVTFYNLHENPCHKAGSIGKKNAEEMKY